MITHLAAFLVGFAVGWVGYGIYIRLRSLG